MHVGSDNTLDIFKGNILTKINFTCFFKSFFLNVAAENLKNYIFRLNYISVVQCYDPDTLMPFLGDPGIHRKDITSERNDTEAGYIFNVRVFPLNL